MPRDLQTVLHALPDGVLVIDPAGRLDWANAEACRILEIPPDAVEGAPLDQVIGTDHPVVALVRRVLENRRPAMQDELWLDRRRAGSLVTDVAASPLDEDDRTPLGAVVLVRDRTVRHSLREWVTERERLESYGQIAAGIAHEVKNPLGGIRGAAELLQMRATDDRARQTAGVIVREVDRISSLVEELMVFARGDVLDEQEVNVHFVLDGVLELLQLDPLTEKIAIERFYDPSIPEFIADPDRLTQVFLNLCRNAAQAMEDTGGTLTITTRMSLDRRLTTPEGRRVPAVIVAVSDTGPGMRPDVLERLETPFFTTRPTGTGLGLAVSRHWVSRHGGTLRMSSQPGEGTTVRVALPLRRLRRLPPGAGTQEEKPS